MSTQSASAPPVSAPASSAGQNSTTATTTTNYNITMQGPSGSNSKRLKKPSFPPVYYYSRSSSILPNIRTNDLPLEPNHRGIYSPWAFVWGFVFAVVPVAYIYICLILLREVCFYLPEFALFVEQYLPPLYTLIRLMHSSSKLVEAWCVLEAIFYVGLKLHMWHLQRRDPLEASLRSAPFMKLSERAILWQRMLAVEEKEPAAMITGWFFDQDIHTISRYDCREWITWSMFEGRNQEHLTAQELEQLEEFVQKLEYRISVHWYGVHDDDDDDDDDDDHLEGSEEVPVEDNPTRQPVPRKTFRFPELEPSEPPNFFSNLYESYRRSYEKYKNMMDKSDFHPMQDFRNFMAQTTQQIIEAEENARTTAKRTAENAMATATQSAENAMAMASQTAETTMNTATQTAAQMYETIIQPVMGGRQYPTIIPPGSQVEKQLTAIGQATHKTHTQLIHAFHSVKQGMTERLETAKFLSTQRKIIRQQLVGYREMLHQLREMSSEVPSKQMAVLMRRITESNQALERLEARAKDAFDQATGYARQKFPFPPSPLPARYAKYSSDPLLGVATYPLGFHLLILGATEIPLRIMMARKGFERRSIGPINYYFHPGTGGSYDDEEEDDDNDYSHSHHDHEDRSHSGNAKNTPLVFVHGIGIGLISYQALVDAMLKSGRPIFLPELPFVSGFRPWQGPNAVLPPAVVCSTMTAMLATHGYLKGAFAGHSYGTSWLAYMCKYAPSSVAALLFLDPICFCLHAPRLTKKFVYTNPDVGTISYIIRTDLIVNWTIQRSFPWAWIILFLEQVHVPCSVFLSEQDALVPAQKVEEYLLSKGTPMVDFKPGMGKEHFEQSGNQVTGCVFRGHGHGDWTDYPTHTVPVIADCLQVLCDIAESGSSD